MGTTSPMLSFPWRNTELYPEFRDWKDWLSLSWSMSSCFGGMLWTTWTSSLLDRYLGGTISVLLVDFLNTHDELVPVALVFDVVF